MQGLTVNPDLKAAVNALLGGLPGTAGISKAIQTAIDGLQKMIRQIQDTGNDFVGERESAATPVSFLRLHRGLAWPVGQAELECSPAVEAPEAGERVWIEDGDASGAINRLMTGRIVRRRQSIHGICLTFARKSGSRPNPFYTMDVAAYAIPHTAARRR